MKKQTVESNQTAASLDVRPESESADI